MERTLILLKPDAIQRRLVGRILARFEQRGLKLAALKMTRISEKTARAHYGAHEGKSFFEPLVRYVSSGPIVAAVIEGKGAISMVRDMMGKTFGSQSSPGTIRGDFAVSNRFNLIHGSDSPEAAAEEIAKFFQPGEIVEYEMDDMKWVYDMSGPEIV